MKDASPVSGHRVRISSFAKPMFARALGNAMTAPPPSSSASVPVPLRCLAVVAASLLLLSMPGCDRGTEPASAASTENGDPTRTFRPRTGAARVGEERVGVYRGSLQQGATTVADHMVEVIADVDGSPNVTIVDFCSLQMRGDGPTFTAEEGSRCLVDLGDGRRARSATGEATFDNGTLRASVRFPDEDVTWTFEGVR